MNWHVIKRANRRAARLADNHYSRQSHGSQQFTPPGRVMVLATESVDAVWATSWPFPQFVHRKAFPTAWTCTIFRNEGQTLSSVLIREAVAATRFVWPDVPEEGMVTMVDPSKVRHKRDPGRCFLKAGFAHAGHTQSGLLILRLAPEAMPEPCPPLGLQLSLLERRTA